MVLGPAKPARKSGECGLLQVWSTTNAKTDRGAVKPLASQKKIFSYSMIGFHHNLEIIERSTA
jgi:hypothetical protein